jgi:hypothetical protein
MLSVPWWLSARRRMVVRPLDWLGVPMPRPLSMTLTMISSFVSLTEISWACRAQFDVAFSDDGESVRGQGVGDGSINRAGEEDVRAVPELGGVLSGDVGDLPLEVVGSAPVDPQLEDRGSDGADGLVESIDVSAEAGELVGVVGEAGQTLQNPSRSRKLLDDMVV